jgi:hypothetical protein
MRRFYARTFVKEIKKLEELEQELKELWARIKKKLRNVLLPKQAILTAQEKAYQARLIEQERLKKLMKKLGVSLAPNETD